MADIENQTTPTEKKKEETNYLYYVLGVLIVLLVIVGGYKALAKTDNLPDFLKFDKSGSGDVFMGTGKKDDDEQADEGDEGDDEEGDDHKDDKDEDGDGAPENKPEEGTQTPRQPESGKGSKGKQPQQKDYYVYDFGDNLVSHSVKGDSFFSMLLGLLGRLQADPKILMAVVPFIGMVLPFIKSFFGFLPLFGLVAAASGIVAFLAIDHILKESEGETTWQKIKNADPINLIVAIGAVGVCVGATGMLLSPFAMPMLTELSTMASGLFSSISGKFVTA